MIAWKSSGILSRNKLLDFCELTQAVVINRTKESFFFRPCLSWRDVQHIIAITAVKVWRNFSYALFHVFHVPFVVTTAAQFYFITKPKMFLHLKGHKLNYTIVWQRERET